MYLQNPCSFIFEVTNACSKILKLIAQMYIARKMKRYKKIAVDEWIERITLGHLPLNRRAKKALILNFWL